MNLYESDLPCLPLQLIVMLFDEMKLGLQWDKNSSPESKIGFWKYFNL